MDREPGCPLPSVGGDDEDGVGGDSHGRAGREADDSGVHAVLGRNEDVGIPPPEAGEDRLGEDLGTQLAHGRAGLLTRRWQAAHSSAPDPAQDAEHAAEQGDRVHRACEKMPPVPARSPGRAEASRGSARR